MNISIILSAFNGEKYITEQLESLRVQSRPADEVLIFDDGSTDHTCDLVRSFIEDNCLSGWKLRRNPENKGWRRSFMEAIPEAEGDCIFFCDQDDLWHADKIARMAAIMEADPSINVLTCNYTAFYESSTEEKKKAGTKDGAAGREKTGPKSSAAGREKTGPNPEDHRLVQQPVMRNYFNTRFPGCTYCFRKSYGLLALKYWEEDFPHDATLWRMSMFDGSLYCLNESLVHWRRHRGSSYTRESIASKGLTTKREWIEYGKRNVRSLTRYLQDTGRMDPAKQSVLNEALRWLDGRARFFDSKNPLDGLALLSCLKTYPKLRQYPGDWYLTYFTK